MRSLPKDRIGVCEIAVQPKVVHHLPACNCLDAAAASGIEIGVDEVHRIELELVRELHLVVARLDFELPIVETDARFPVVRLLRAQVKIGGNTKQRRANALVDIGDTEALRHAAEQRHAGHELVLDAEMPGVVGFTLVERQTLNTEEALRR